MLSNDTDVDSPTLAAVLVSGPAHGTVTLNANGSFTYTPAANFNGPDSFTYTKSRRHGERVQRGDGPRSPVTAVNDAPVATDQAVGTDEDTATAIALSATDGRGLASHVLDASGPAHGTLSGTAPVVTYTPTANYNGADSFTFTANDGALDSNAATVSITVTAVNDAPVATDQAVGSDDEHGLVTAIALGNATDVEQGSLTYAVRERPVHGTLSGTAPTFTYTFRRRTSTAPTASRSRPMTAPRLERGDGLIAVTAVNDAPVATDQAVGTDEDTATAIALSATDAEGSPLTYAIGTGPAHGTLSGTAPTVTYTPAANYNGPDSFTFTANDGSLASNAATVTITVTAVNDAPVAAVDSYTTTEDTPLTIAAPGVLANDTDVDSTALTAGLVSGPAHGTLTLNPDGSFIYTPAANFSGSDSFTYDAYDASSDSNVATVTITVTAVNDAPVAADQAVVTDEDTAKAIALGVTDPDSTTFTYTIGTPPAHGTLSGSAPTLIHAPALNYNGPDSFTFRRMMARSTRTSRRSRSRSRASTMRPSRPTTWRRQPRTRRRRSPSSPTTPTSTATRCR